MHIVRGLDYEGLASTNGLIHTWLHNSIALLWGEGRFLRWNLAVGRFWSLVCLILGSTAVTPLGKENKCSHISVPIEISSQPFLASPGVQHLEVSDKCSSVMAPAGFPRIEFWDLWFTPVEGHPSVQHSSKHRSLAVNSGCQARGRGSAQCCSPGLWGREEWSWPWSL